MCKTKKKRLFLKDFLIRRALGPPDGGGDDLHDSEKVAQDEWKNGDFFFLTKVLEQRTTELSQALVEKLICEGKVFERTSPPNGDLRWHSGGNCFLCH